MIAAGVHCAGTEELAVGIKNAYRLLRPDGALEAMAKEAGFTCEEDGKVHALNLNSFGNKIESISQVFYK